MTGLRRILAVALACAVLSLPAIRPAGASVEAVALTAETRDGFVRLRFDWAEPVGVDAKIGGRRLVIRFDRSFSTSLRGARAVLEDFVAAANLEPDLRTLALNLRRDLEMRETVLGSTVYFDLWLPGTPPPEPPTLSGTSARNDEATVERPPAPPQLGMFTPPTRKPPVPNEPVEMAQPDEADPGSSGDPPVDLLAKAEAPPFMTAQRVENGADLRFDWTESVAAAVFRRGPHVWLVFDRHAEAELEAAREALGDIVASLQEVPAGQGLALRLALPEWLNPEIRREERSWIVSIRRRALRPNRPFTVERREEPDGSDAVVLPFDGAGDVVTVTDPEVGDTIVVVPVIPARLGLAEDRTFAQFALLRSAQGVVVLPQADSLSVERQRWGVRIATPDGLAVSNGEVLAENIEGDGEGADLAARRLFDFEAWAGGGADRYLERKRELFAAIAMAAPDALSSRRLDLARFYFAHGLHNEANGVLRRLAEEDPEIAGRPANRALAGAVRVLTGDIDGASQLLLPQDFEGNRDAALWRAMVRAAEGEADKASAEFERGAGVLASYPARFRVPLVLAAIANARDGDELDRAESLFALFDGLDLPPDQAGLRSVLKGRLFAAQGAPDRAEEEWEAASRPPGSLAAGLARLERTLADLDRARIDPDTAIETLEGLRFDWRGGDLEFRTLEALGDLYAEKGNFALALARLRDAATYFPGHPDVLDATERMSEIFAGLFLDGAAADMPPVAALALFNEYRELTPPGVKGERMVFALAERLVAADLLDQAGALLDHQVRFRLAGAERARAGALLAEVRLAQKQPEDALAALRASAAPALVRPLVDRRLRLEAHALLEVGNTTKARALLIGDQSGEAEVLRAEIAWQAQEWSAAAAAYARLIELAPMVPKGGPLDRVAAYPILRRAVALAMAGQRGDLREFVAQWGDAMGESPYGGEFAAVAEGLGGGEKDYRSLAQNLGAVAALRKAIAVLGTVEPRTALR
jgi:tetratricopeptide (TPR) repeat protein